MFKTPSVSREKPMNPLLDDSLLHKMLRLHKLCRVSPLKNVKRSFTAYIETALDNNNPTEYKVVLLKCHILG